MYLVPDIAHSKLDRVGNKAVLPMLTEARHFAICGVGNSIENKAITNKELVDGEIMLTQGRVNTRREARRQYEPRYGNSSDVYITI